MRKVIHAGAVTVLLCGTVLAGSSPAAADDKERDVVKGSGVNDPPNGNYAKFKINTKSDADGSDPDGKAGFDLLEGPNKFTGAVQCLKVVGNRATIVITLDKRRGVGEQFTHDILWIEDNGKPVKGEPVDYVRNSLRKSEPSCDEPFERADNKLSKGNVKVVDGQGRSMEDAPST